MLRGYVLSREGLRPMPRGVARSTVFAMITAGELRDVWLTILLWHRDTSTIAVSVTFYVAEASRKRGVGRQIRATPKTTCNIAAVCACLGPNNNLLWSRAAHGLRSKA